MSFTYTCEYPADGRTWERPGTLCNPHVNDSKMQYIADPEVEIFHRSLPDANETPLHDLPTLAEELGFAHVFLKDESLRFGLPSFKPTGASWAVYKTLCKQTGSQTGISVQELHEKCIQQPDLVLVTATAGNWGRAVSKMAKLLGVRAVIYVPNYTPTYTQDLIRQEGGEVHVVEGAIFDGALAQAALHARQTGALLVVDVDIEGCGDTPKWVADGYHTILYEVDRQVSRKTGRSPDLVSCSVGAGSWAQAVVSHYKSQHFPVKTISVEPVLAPSVKEALHEGRIVTIQTGNTIMNGMNCGTVSGVAWPVLRDGLDIATVVTDLEAHRCVEELQKMGINAGPCGAANLAGLRRVCREVELPNKHEMIVVLLSSEGMREYQIPQ